MTGVVVGTADPYPLRSMSEHPLKERLEQLAERKREAYHAGSDRAVERQHAKGKLTDRKSVV